MFKVAFSREFIGAASAHVMLQHSASSTETRALHVERSIIGRFGWFFRCICDCGLFLRYLTINHPRYDLYMQAIHIYGFERNRFSNQ